jgi:hypothetical protein
MKWLRDTGILLSIVLVLLEPKNSSVRIILLACITLGLILKFQDADWIMQRTWELNVVEKPMVSENRSYLKLTCVICVVIGAVAVLGAFTWPPPDQPFTKVIPVDPNRQPPVPVLPDPTKPPKEKPKPPKPKPLEPEKTPTPHPNPLDPFDGAPNSKVAADTLDEVARLRTTYQACTQGFSKAMAEDQADKNQAREKTKMFLVQGKGRVQEYASDFQNLHASLIYRLGPSYKDADGERSLNELLDKTNPVDFFYCNAVQDVGNYLATLAARLKAKGD